MAPFIAIDKHTTASVPHPHILYTVDITIDTKSTVVEKRYSEFVELHNALGVKDLSLPPKRVLTTTFIPSAWADDQLIAERKAGLTRYLSSLVNSSTYRGNAILEDFLTISVPNTSPEDFDPEDAVPSTLSRAKALELKAAALSAPEGDVEATAVPIAATYYPDWSAGTNPPENIDFSKYDIIFYSFAVPNSSSTLSFESGSTAILRRLVTAAKNSGKGTKIVLSVGGWGGSYWFSQSCINDANRTKLANALVSAVNTYGLAGVDLDWEYPNSVGAGNPKNSNDANNFLRLMQKLRGKLGWSKVISAAVAHLPWIGSNGQPMTNVKDFANQMTYVNIMNYDVWGSSATPGPNAPLGNLCGTSKQPKANAQAALKQWTAAGFPAQKLLLGLPLYGYVSQSSKTVLTGSSLPSPDMVLLESETVTVDGGEEGKATQELHFVNGAHPRSKEVPEVTVTANLQKYYGQQLAFKEILKAGALVKTSTGYNAAGGFTRGWDNCSNTPFLYNKSQNTVVSYDDNVSIGDKAAWAKNNGMAGVFTWSMDQDDGKTLQNAIRSRLGR